MLWMQGDKNIMSEYAKFLADGAKKRTEVLWINDSAWNVQQGKLL